MKISEEEDNCESYMPVGYEGLYYDYRIRFEQLEQVAWEMFITLEAFYLDNKLKPKSYAYYRDRLEALGIETGGFKTKKEKEND